MQQQNFLLLPDVKQEPRSPNYVDLANTSATSPPPHRYTPSPNTLNSTSMSPNIPVQQHYDMGNYIPSVSPLQNANMLNQQYSTQTTNPNQFITNQTMVAMNTNSNQCNQTEQRNIEDIFTNNNLDNINQFDNATNTNVECVSDNVSSMNISNLLDLDSQQQINSNLLFSNDLLSDLFNRLDNGENQEAIPITINAIQTNNMEEENMTDSFKQISIE